VPRGPSGRDQAPTLASLPHRSARC
jgi:hypothetical protein